jgi:hypothetical protein
MNTIELAVFIRIEFRFDEQIVLNPVVFEGLDDLGKPIDEDGFGIGRYDGVLGECLAGQAHGLQG